MFETFEMQGNKIKTVWYQDNCLSEVSRSHSKRYLKCRPQNSIFLTVKAILKCYTLNCRNLCLDTFPQSYLSVCNLVLAKTTFS